jgi:hypothetical protein
MTQVREPYLAENDSGTVTPWQAFWLPLLSIISIVALPVTVPPAARSVV